MGIAKRTKPWPDPKPKLFEVRPLTTEDIAALKTDRGKSTRPLQQLRDSHHLVARLIASGLRTDEVVEQSGYSYQAIYRLNADPAFQELLALYREQVAISHRDITDEYHRILVANRMKAERQIADRLDDEEAAISTRDLITITRDAADRTGYGKRSTQVRENGFASEMESVWARSGAAKLIDGVSSPGLAPSAAAPPSSAPAPTEPASRDAAPGFQTPQNFAERDSSVTPSYSGAAPVLAPAPLRRGL